MGILGALYQRVKFPTLCFCYTCDASCALISLKSLRNAISMEVEKSTRTKLKITPDIPADQIFANAAIIRTIISRLPTSKAQNLRRLRPKTMRALNEKISSDIGVTNKKFTVEACSVNIPT